MIKQANSKHCFVCGVSNPFGLQLKFYSSAPGEVTSAYTVPEKFQGYPGLVHGGIVAAMLDEVTGRVYMGNAETPRFMYTARLEVKYRKNVPAGEPLRLVGRAVKDNGRIATAKGEVYGPDGSLLAEAEAVLVDVPTETFANVDLDALGWRVYPDEELFPSDLRRE